MKDVKMSTRQLSTLLFLFVYFYTCMLHFFVDFNHMLRFKGLLYYTLCNNIYDVGDQYQLSTWLKQPAVSLSIHWSRNDIASIIGASLSEPHMNGTSVCDLFIWYVVRQSPYTIHCAHSKIFCAIQTARCNVRVLHCAGAAYIATCSRV